MTWPRVGFWAALFAFVAFESWLESRPAPSLDRCECICLDEVAP
jgi:hypothetical protein